MKKRLKINIVSSILSYIVTAAISFLLTPYLVKTLGKEVFGFYSIANNFVNYITIVAVALNSMSAKFITVEIVRKNEDRALEYFSSIFFANLILCAILIPVLVLIVLFLEKLLTISSSYLTDVKILFSLIFSAMVVRLIFSVYGSATYAKERIDINSVVSIFKALLKIVLYYLLFKIFVPSVIYLGIVLLILEIFNSVVQIVLCRRLLPNMRIKRKMFKPDLIKSTIKIGAWNSVNQLGDSLLSSSDLICSNLMLGESASGDISIIKTMPTMISGVITAINSSFVPRLAKSYGCNDRQGMITEVTNAQSIMGFIITPIVVLLIIFGFDFYALWVPGNDTCLLGWLSAIDIARMAIIGVVWPLSNLNIVMDKVKIPSLVVVLSGIVNIVSMILIIKFTMIGIYTIVWTTFVITIMFYGIFIPFYSARLLDVRPIVLYKSVIKMIICTIVLFAIFVPLHSILEIKTWFDFVLYGGLYGILALIISAFIFLGKKTIVYIKSFFKIHKQSK